MNSTPLCADASLVIKLLLDEEDSDLARGLWLRWARTDANIVAPYHLVFETLSVVRNRVYRRLITEEEGERALRTFQGLDISLVHSEELCERAWTLATRFNRPTVYDSYYLALADTLACEFWTADKRVYNAVNGALSWVHLLKRDG